MNPDKDYVENRILIQKMRSVKIAEKELVYKTNIKRFRVKNINCFNPKNSMGSLGGLHCN